MRARLGLVALAAGLLCALVAWYYWTAGSPPLWSFVAPRAEAIVTRAELVETAGPDGRTGQRAIVEVAWPPGAETDAEVTGLASPHRRWHLHAPFELVRDHPPGTKLTVRVVGGRPVADRTDLYELAYAVLFTLFAAGLTATGLALISGRRTRHHNREETAE